MRESESLEVAGVPEHLLDELAHTLAEKLDILLDRLTDRALAVPDAGTSAWHVQWLERDSESGRHQRAQRLYIRAVLASRAGIGLGQAARPVSEPSSVTRAPRARKARRGADDNQLAIF